MYSLGIPETTTDVPARSRMLTQSTYDLRYEKNVSRAVLPGTRRDRAKSASSTVASSR